MTTEKTGKGSRGRKRSGILNKTRQEVLAKEYTVCRSIASKAKGLMFTNRSSVIERALIFEFDRPRFQSMHMFFVFYPIDVLFLDGNGKVVDMKKMFKPFTVYNSGKRSTYVIELPHSTIEKSNTCLGDVISWQ